MEHHHHFEGTLHQRSSSIKVILQNRRSSSIKGHLPSKAVFHQRWSSIKGRLPSKVVLHKDRPKALFWRSMKGQTLTNVRRAIRGRPPSNVVFYPRAAPEVPPKWIKQYELGRLDNKLTGTGRQTDRRTHSTTYGVRLTLWLKIIVLSELFSCVC